MLCRFSTTVNLATLEDYKNYSPCKYSTHFCLLVSKTNNICAITPRMIFCLNFEKVDQLCVPYLLPSEYIPRHFVFIDKVHKNQDSTMKNSIDLYIYQRKLVTVELGGGIGNRLFQLACAHRYARQNNKTLCFSKSLVPSCEHAFNKAACYTNTLFETVPFIEEKFQSIFLDKTLTDIIIEKPEQFSQFVEWPSNRDRHTLLKGYFQSSQYIHSNFIKEVAPKLSDVRIQRQKTCFLHIRRGDYVGNSYHFINLTGYYLECMRRKLSENVKTIIVCSNDITWCKKQWYLKNDELPKIINSKNENVSNTAIQFDDEKDELKTLLLMASCTHGGIAGNSSFSWWGAWLSMHFSSAQESFIPNKWLPTNPSWPTEFEVSNKIIQVDIDTFFLPVYYINCEHRKDRDNECRNELEVKLHIDSKYITRVDAVYLPNRGHLGCAASHVSLLKSFLNGTKYPAIMVVEDDMESIAGNLVPLKNFLTTLDRPDIFDKFEGILLGGGQVVQESCQMDHCVQRLKTAQETVGYVVSRKGAKNLIDIWTDSMINLDNEKIEQHQQCIDQKWKILHEKGNWYITCPILIKQRYSYSDIERRWKS